MLIGEYLVCCGFCLCNSFKMVEVRGGVDLVWRGDFKFLFFFNYGCCLGLFLIYMLKIFFGVFREWGGGEGN